MSTFIVDKNTQIQLTQQGARNEPIRLNLGDLQMGMTGKKELALQIGGQLPTDRTPGEVQFDKVSLLKDSYPKVTS